MKYVSWVFIRLAFPPNYCSKDKHMSEKCHCGKKKINGICVRCRGLSESLKKQQMTFGGNPFNC